MNIDIKKYVVPLYIIDDDGSNFFNGTGYIINNYLITAGHVTCNNGSIIFLFEGNEYLLENPLYETKESCIDGNIKHDLTIFRIDLATTSPILLSDVRQNDRVDGLLCGYSYNADQQCLQEDEENISVRNFAFDYFNSPPIPLSNCSVFTPNIGKQGNSGCPIFDNSNKVIGMLLGSTGQNSNVEEGLMLRSEYITEIVEGINSNTGSTNNFTTEN